MSFRRSHRRSIGKEPKTAKGSEAAESQNGGIGQYKLGGTNDSRKKATAQMGV